MVRLLVLSCFQADELFVVENEACSMQIGCSLLPGQPAGHRQPIAYWSRISGYNAKSLSSIFNGSFVNQFSCYLL